MESFIAQVVLSDSSKITSNKKILIVSIYEKKKKLAL